MGPVYTKCLGFSNSYDEILTKWLKTGKIRQTALMRLTSRGRITNFVPITARFGVDLLVV